MAFQGYQNTWPPIAVSAVSTATFATSAAANWFYFAIVPLTGGTLSKVRLYVSSVTGSLGANDIVCELYSSTNGAPNASIESRNTVTTTPTGAAVVEVTGFTSTLTAGTLYFLILRNANGTPASNYYTIRYVTWINNAPSSVATLVSGASWLASSTNSGSTWTLSSWLPSVVIEYSGGAKEGSPSIQGGGAHGQIYDTRELGLYATSPPTTMRVIGITSCVVKTGTPTGDLRYRLYTGASPTLQRTTGTLAPAAVNTSSTGLKPLYFSSSYDIPASTVVRVVVSETTQSDASSNRYTIGAMEYNTADASIALPFCGTPKSTLSTNGGTSFTETDGFVPQIYLILDSDVPFPAPAASGLAANPLKGFIS